MHAHYGNISTWARGSTKFINIFGAANNRDLLSRPDDFVIDAFREHNLPAGSSFERLTLSLMRLNGAEHKRHRRLIMPAFSKARLETYLSVVVEKTRSALQGWSEGERRQLDKDLFELVTSISLQTMFGFDTPERSRKLVSLIERLIKQASSPLLLILPFNAPGLPMARILKTTGEIEAFIQSVISEKRQTDQPARDVLSAMIMSRDEENASFSDEELIAHAYMVLCQESVASALLWIVFLLDRHRDWRDILNAELDETLNGQPPCLSDLSSLSQMDAVIKEALRLFPSAPFGIRYSARDTSLAGYDLTKGSGVFFSSYVSHRDPDVFQDPLQFRPERWRTASPDIYAYLPFGAGVHFCIGQNLALAEIKTILALILQTFDTNLSAGSKIDLAMGISLVPKPGLTVDLSARGRGNGTPVDLNGTVIQALDLK
jgi:cytochrome P450